MKDSKIEWLGDIPEHWEIKKIKHLFRLVCGATPSPDNDNWDGDIYWITPADYQTKDKYVSTGKRNITMKGFLSCSADFIPVGSIIFSKRAPIGKVAINKEILCTNQGCISCISKTDTVNDYFYYVMSVGTDYFELSGNGATFKEISVDNFSNCLLPFPPVEEQEEIVKFLDKKCTDIDKIISIKNQQIDLLKEYKKALITETVTKGLNKDVEMKESGIDYIGKMPAHWKIEKVKNVVSMIGSGTTPSGEKYYENGNICWLQSGDIYGKNEITESSVLINKTALNENSTLKLYNHDFIIMAMYGSIGSVSISKTDACVNQACCCIKPDNNNNIKFMYYWLLICKTDFLRISKCNTQPNISQSKIKNQCYIQPPLEEQEEIVKFLDKKCNDIDKIISLKNQQIEIIKEYKKAIIYEYVTGKRKV
ncbi:MAG: hypothetical protein HDT23_02640 [Ruminococcus sp.]|nr:hypothetical protein [Ruminococcus sp.]